MHSNNPSSYQRTFLTMPHSTHSTTTSSSGHCSPDAEQTTRTATRHRLRRRILGRQRWSISGSCLLLCISAVLLRSPSYLLPHSLLPMVPVACAVELRQQPTKDLDKNNGNNKKPTTLTQIRTNDRPMTLNQLLRKAGKKGLGGGIPGLIAGVFQVRIMYSD